MAALCLVCSTSAVLAQSISPSQITPPTLRPDLANDRAVTSLGGTVQGVPEGASHLVLSIGTITIEGGFSELASETEPLTAAVERRSVSVADVYALAAAIEEVYARAGFVLVRVTVPPQEVSQGGSLRIVVLDGFIESVDVTAIPAPVQDLVLRRTRSLVGLRHVKLVEIERRLLLAGDLPGLRLRSTLARGKAPGATKLVLDGDFQHTSVSVGGDNHLPGDLGKWRATAFAALNSAIGQGEQVYASLASDTTGETPFRANGLVSIGGFGVVIPIGNDGLTFNPEYAISETGTRGDRDLATAGRFERTALRLAYPAIETRALELTVSLAGEHITQTSEATDFGVVINHDDYWALRIGAQGRAALEKASLSGAFTISQGLTGRDQEDALQSEAPLSRSEATPEFSKLAGRLQLAIPVASNRASLTALAQTAFGTSVFRSEQFSLDGTEALSNFEAGALSVDTGLTLRAEFAREMTLNIAGHEINLEGYVFGAAGWGRISAPTALETPSLRAESYGLGLRSSLSSIAHLSGSQATLEVGRGVLNGADTGEWRFLTSANVGF